MIRMSALIGQRVITRDSGQLLGSVHRLNLDAQSARVVSLELEGVIDRDTIVEWPAIAAIGESGVVIGSAGDRRAPLGAAEQAFTSGELDLLGKLVLQDDGEALGSLEDVIFDERTGKVRELRVPGQTLPVARIVALGSYALIVPAPDA